MDINPRANLGPVDKHHPPNPVKVWFTIDTGIYALEHENPAARKQKQNNIDEIETDPSGPSPHLL